VKKTLRSWGCEQTKKELGGGVMKCEIKNRFSGSVIFTAETKSFKLAVEMAVKARADLSRADLSRAYLSRANLSGADGISKYRTTPLYMLLDQVGKIRAYKLTNAKGEGPFSGGIKYIVGETVSCNADTNENNQCSYGISVATLDWCIANWQEEYKIKIVEFTAKDIACIPIASDGKFRVSKCKVIGEKDLKELGL
jgi:hypothetical protein